MSEAEVAAYRQRLTDEVADWIDEIEATHRRRRSAWRSRTTRS